MVDHLDGGDPLDAAFAALADPTRRDILARLARAPSGAPVAISELAAPYEMSLQAVSKHVHALERAGLVACGKEGRVRRCRLVPDRLRDATTWLESYRAFWEDRFDALDAYLRSGRGQAGGDQQDKGGEDL